MSKADGHSGRPLLTVSREEAEQRIDEQIKRTGSFLPAGENKVTYEYLSSGHRSWEDYTFELLKHIFTTEELANEFKAAGHLSFHLNMSPAERFRLIVDQTRRQVAALHSIGERLEFFEPLPRAFRPMMVVPIETTSPRANSTDVGVDPESVAQLDDLNLLTVYEVLLDLREELNIAPAGASVSIPLIGECRFRETGERNDYPDRRFKAVRYLETKGS